MKTSFSQRWPTFPNWGALLILVAALHNSNAATSQLVSGAAPPVTITAPTNGSVLAAPASFTLRASVSGGGNNVSQVEFFAGATSLGVDTSNPYRMDVNGLGAGAYTLLAVLTDTLGDKSSNSVDIIVNALPIVSITSPPDGSGLIAPATFALQADASDSDGAVTRLQFFRGTSAIGVTTTNPAAVLVKGLGSGSYTFSVVATDNLGGTSSTNIDLVVKTRPAVVLTAPAAGARLTEVTNLLTGTATDTYGVASVVYSLNSGPFLLANGTTDWSASLALPAGTNVVRVRATDTYGNASLTNARSFFQVVPSVLNLTVSGNGTVSGATNGQLLEVNRGYQLTATPASGHLFSNWTGSVSGSLPTLGFLMQSNMVLQANFVSNPFLRVSGAFNGLFYETNEARHGTSGDFNLRVTTAGKFSAAVRLAGVRHRATGFLNLEGKATTVILRTGLAPLTVRWAVDLHGLDQVTGTVSDGNWTAPLLGDRATFNAVTNPAPWAARYTVVVPQSEEPGAPEGDGWGTLRVTTSGSGLMVGFLSDGTRVNRKAPLSKNGAWPLYAPLYQLQGSVLGWIQFDTNAPTDDLRGRLDWFKPAQPGVAIDPEGLTNQTILTGSRYVAPTSSTNRVLALANGVVILTGGNLSQDWTNTITLGANNRVTNTSPNMLSVSLVLGSGLFKGTFLDPVASRTVNFSGALLQKSTNGSGFHLGPSESGRVAIEWRP